jgi:hypothetical protein
MRQCVHAGSPDVEAGDDDLHCMRKLGKSHHWCIKSSKMLVLCLSRVKNIPSDSFGFCISSLRLLVVAIPRVLCFVRACIGPHRLTSSPKQTESGVSCMNGVVSPELLKLSIRGKTKRSAPFDIVPQGIPEGRRLQLDVILERR